MAEILLSARNLSKRFGGITAVNGIDLEVHDRELLCLIGPNGAGKSTLLNLLCGVQRPDSGKLQLDGKDLAGFPIHGFARAGVLRKFQVPAVFSDLTVRQNLMTAGDASGQLYNTRDIDLILERLSLTADQAPLAGTLAHGKMQWLEIGICLMCRPKLLLLDEPTAGMTVTETMNTARLVKELSGMSAVAVVEHDMAFVRELDCRTCVLHQGKIIRDDRFEVIEKDHLIREIYLGHG
jgi:branched-chain amino acid transport system ATP-binding protein